MSSNHYVVRIYPLILPPSALFPSLHPSRLFPSLCCRSAGHLTTLNVLQPLFVLQNNASSLPTLLRDPFICQLIFFFFFGVSCSALHLVCHAAAHINRFVLEMFSGTNRVSATLFHPILVLYFLKYELCKYNVHECLCVCMHSIYLLYCILP